MLLASSAIPGGFPPVLIGVEANGKQFQEMHVDGGVGGQFFVAPAAVMAATSDYRLPATALYVVINTGLQPGFQLVTRSTPSIFTGTVGAAVKVDTRLMIDRAYLAAKRSGVEFNIATDPCRLQRAEPRPVRSRLYDRAVPARRGDPGKAQRPLPMNRRPIQADQQHNRRPTLRKPERTDDQGWGLYHCDGCCDRAFCRRPVRRASGR